jgi:hypothetical protein
VFSVMHAPPALGFHRPGWYLGARGGVCWSHWNRWSRWPGRSGVGTVGPSYRMAPSLRCKRVRGSALSGACS